MKNLLKHITCQELTVGAVFEHLYSSFTQEEDSSVVERMKPGRFWSLVFVVGDQFTSCIDLKSTQSLTSSLSFKGANEIFK